MPPTKTRPTPDDLRRMYQDERLTQRQIAARTGYSYATIREWLKNAGIEGRREGWADPEGRRAKAKARAFTITEHRDPTPPRVVDAAPAAPPAGDDEPAIDMLISRDEARRLAKAAAADFREYCERRRMLRQFAAG